MLEIIKALVGEGFEVRIIEIKKPVIVGKSIEEKQDESIGGGVDKKMKFVERIQKVSKKSKRINWKTINKIKEAKADGCTSGETAEELELPLDVVNKYWVE